MLRALLFHLIHQASSTGMWQGIGYLPDAVKINPDRKSIWLPDEPDHPLLSST
jgi:hypothetical protein